MKRLRSVLALVAALTSCALLASCGTDVPATVSNPESRAASDMDASSIGSSSEASDSSAAESKNPEDKTAEDITPANYSDSWKGEIKTRTVLYYMDGELVDDQLVEAYEYDENGRVDKISLTYRDEYYQYQYDDHGNVVQWEDVLEGETAFAHYYEYEYYDDGQISRKTTYVSLWGAEEEPTKLETLLYDTQGREAERINYNYLGAESSHLTFVYDDSKPHECVINSTRTDYETDGTVRETHEYTAYGYTLPDARGGYRFDEFDNYASYDFTTEAAFFKYYAICTQGQPSCTYDEHGSVTDDGVECTYAYEYSSSGMLLKASCYSLSGGLIYEHEYDGNGHIISYNSADLKNYTSNSLPLSQPYNEVVYQYEFY